MKILNKIIEILFNKKFSFRRLKKKPVLIYDKLSLRELNDLIPSKKIEVLDNREEINLLIILKMLINLKFGKNYYYKFYLNTVSPNLIITTSDHDIFFYKIKEIYPYAKTAIIQLSYRHDKFGDLFSILKNKKIKKKYKIDYIFCFGADFAKEYKKYINGKAITVGSVRNNKLIKFKKKKKTISFISQFRNRSKTNEDYIFHRWKNKKLMHSEFFSLEKKLIPLIADFCKKKKL